VRRVLGEALAGGRSTALIGVHALPNGGFRDVLATTEAGISRVSCLGLVSGVTSGSCLRCHGIARLARLSLLAGCGMGLASTLGCFATLHRTRTSIYSVDLCDCVHQFDWLVAIYIVVAYRFGLVGSRRLAPDNVAVVGNVQNAKS
jgi:hypothetical protein